jgi:hypothetical protein
MDALGVYFNVVEEKFKSLEFIVSANERLQCLFSMWIFCGLAFDFVSVEEF